MVRRHPQGRGSQHRGIHGEQHHARHPRPRGGPHRPARDLGRSLELQAGLRSGNAEDDRQLSDSGRPDSRKIRARLMRTAAFLALAGCVASSRSLAEVPNPQLLPTTQAIHAAITKTPDPEASTMEPYAENVKLAKDATVELVPISGGEFVLGSPDSEAGRKPDEGPQRKIKIEPFWMGKMEVTWNLYRPFMENGKARNKDGTLNRDSDLTTSESPNVKDGETLSDTVTQPTPPYMPMHFQMGDGYSKDFPAVGMTQH
ncbi:MAG: hypothetical protein EOP85_17370, partial [Verrucomicrobiaceae bacterium]